MGSCDGFDVGGTVGCDDGFKLGFSIPTFKSNQKYARKS